MVGNTFYKNRKVVKIRLKKNCKICSMEFLIYPCKKNTALYCSKKCKDFSLIGKKRPDIFKIQKERHLEGKLKIAQKGEKSYNWIEDRTQLKKSDDRRFDTEYKYWTFKVKERDGGKCKIYNKDCNGRLEVHHILNWVNYSELRYEINNGITLCHAHHPRGRKNEAKLSPFFQSLVAEGK